MIRNLWLRLLHLITHPGVTFRDMKDSVPVWPSLVIAAVVSLGGGTYFAEALLPDIGWLPAYVFIGVITGLLVFFASILVLHATARLARGRGGGVRDLMRLWGYVYVPQIVVAIPVIAILRLAVFREAPQGYASPAWLVGIVVIALATIVWCLVLQIQVLRVTYRFTVLGSIFVLMLSGAVSDTIAWVPRTMLVQFVSTRAAGLMDPMDARVARDIRVILQRESALARGSDLRDGWMTIPVNMRTYPPNRGDAVVFFTDEHSRRDLRRLDVTIDLGLGGEPSLHASVGVARVVGLPGEIVAVKEGSVVLNGNKLDEPYVTTPGDISLPPVEVPDDSFFVLGDNRSLDPASYGAGVVRGDKILGGPLRTWSRIFVPLARLLVFG